MELHPYGVVSEVNRRPIGFVMEQWAYLVGDLSGAYSRRVNIQHRVIYQVFEEKRAVKALRMCTHYE